jgi:hypothetical protein
MLPTLTQIKANDHRQELVRAARNHRRAREARERIVTDELIPALATDPGYADAHYLMVGYLLANDAIERARTAAPHVAYRPVTPR